MNKTEVEIPVDALDCQDDELGIIECLEDYHRILINAARKTALQKRRFIALSRAQMVKQLIDRLKSLEDEPEVPN